MPESDEHAHQSSNDDDDLPAWLQEIRQTPPKEEAKSSQGTVRRTSPAPPPRKTTMPQPEPHNQLGVKATLRLWYTLLRHPHLQTYQAAKSKANLTTALIWMAAAGLVGGLFSSALLLLGLGLLMFFEGQTGFTGFDFSMLGLFAGFGALLNIFFSTLFGPVYGLVASAILLVIAKLYGGAGEFEAQTYLVSALFAPFYLALGVLGFIPIIGWLMLLIYFVYLIRPGRYVIQTVHQLSPKKSLYVVLIPIGTIAAFYGLFFTTWSFFVLQALFG